MFGFIRGLFRREPPAPPGTLTPDILASKIEEMIKRARLDERRPGAPPIATIEKPATTMAADIDVKGEAQRAPRLRPARKTKSKKKPR